MCVYVIYIYMCVSVCVCTPSLGNGMMIQLITLHVHTCIHVSVHLINYGHVQKPPLIFTSTNRPNNFLQNSSGRSRYPLVIKRVN